MARQRSSREARQPIDGARTRIRRDSACISTKEAELSSSSTPGNVALVFGSFSIMIVAICFASLLAVCYGQLAGLSSGSGEGASTFGFGSGMGQSGMSGMGGMSQFSPLSRTRSRPSSSFQDMMMPFALMGGGGDRMMRIMMFHMMKSGAFNKMGPMGQMMPLMMMRGGGNDKMMRMMMLSSMMQNKSMNPMMKMMMMTMMNGGGEMKKMLPMLMMMGSRQGGGSGQIPMPALAMMMQGNA